MKLLQIPPCQPKKKRIKKKLKKIRCWNWVEDRHKDENTDDIYNEGVCRVKIMKMATLDMRIIWNDDDEGKLPDYKTRDDNYGDDEEPIVYR